MQYDSPQALLQHAQSFAGFTLGELAERYKEEIPQRLLHKKGWIGQFLELILGAESGSLAQPDFPELGVELKTLPIDELGNPLESTYVSVVPLINIQGLYWENSVVRHKLMHVLWVPIVSSKHLAVEDRQIAMPFLWKPTAEEANTLKQDFEDVLDQVSMGNIDNLDARYGDILQVRPKAANSKALTDAIGPEGSTIRTLPRGFYLRPQFTKSCLKRQFN
ncbi:DNA mismatch repair endonuclease MutH [Kangiella sediminilitoris]|uniref:DNA mismatch repair protein MutH n=1 Tax=Kangiella sediminilitoris TaxID=1144748 RepID=A0A1B3B7Y8_9GAMM|nr:DNA mismatch repair endonuclease MutH [Kangiella sediminilitoris]AOE48896.1 DNA mismatch repair protein [Kangiella sediminilitoris]